MGIPKLMQDLLPYADLVCLGDNVGTEIDLAIQSLVIDGPSLVYFVYNRLVAFNASHSSLAKVRPPTYDEIDEAFLFLLSEFDNYGVKIEGIYFDGALPCLKRGVRLERLEKTRQQLDSYHKMHSETPSHPVTTNRVSDFEKAIWRSGSISNRSDILPPPPFMVASVVEAVSGTRWRDRYFVVPYEADSACAHFASSVESAVLSNDSDLVLYDLGKAGHLVLLQSLDKQCLGQGKRAVLTARALYPTAIAKRMNVPSLLRLGFERSRDVTQSSLNIQKRARDVVRFHENKIEYQLFKTNHNLPDYCLLTSTLKGLDPRTAEFVVQVGDLSRRKRTDLASITANIDSTVNIYLPILHEDPSRDSAWSYGIETRQLAYSLFIQHSTVFGSMQIKSGSVIEYARKGSRIASTPIVILDRSSCIERLETIVQITMAVISNASPDSQCMDQSILSVLQWYTLALSFVLVQRESISKLPPWDDIANIFALPLQHVTGTTGGALLGSGNKKKRAKSKQSFPSNNHEDPKIESKEFLNWNHLHLHASCQAVLYSFRILKQLLLLEPTPISAAAELGAHSKNTTALRDDISNETEKKEDQLHNLTQQILPYLETQPKISQLFLDMHSLHRLFSSLPTKQIQNILNPLKERFYG